MIRQINGSQYNWYGIIMSPWIVILLGIITCAVLYWAFKTTPNSLFPTKRKKKT